MIRYYVLPTESVGIFSGPKYFHWRYDPDPPGIDCFWARKDYRAAPACILAADIAQPDHEKLRTLRDVSALPYGLDGNMPGADRHKLAKVLEKSLVPRYWLAGAITAREAIRTITCMFLYMDELVKLGGSPFEWPVSLETRWYELSAQQKDWIKQACRKNGYTFDFVTVNTQLQAILKGMADQWGKKPIRFGFTDV